MSANAAQIGVSVEQTREQNVKFERVGFGAISDASKASRMGDKFLVSQDDNALAERVRSV